MIEHSAEVDQLFAALVKFQGSMRSVQKTTINTFFGSKYADLADVVETARPHLLEAGLAVSQWPGTTDDRQTLKTILAHESGQWMAETMDLFMPKEDAQGQGSAITYARRYAYSAALGIVSDADDDGQAAAQSPYASSSRRAPKNSEPAAPKQVSEAQVKLIGALADQLNYGCSEDAVTKHHGSAVLPEHLTMAEARKVIEALQAEKQGAPV